MTICEHMGGGALDVFQKNLISKTSGSTLAYGCCGSLVSGVPTQVGSAALIA